MAQVYFHEKQSIPFGWKVFIFMFVTLAMGFVFIMIYMTEWDTMPAEEKPFLATLLIGPLSILIIFFIRLDLRITQTHIEFKLSPFRKTYRSIPFTDVSELDFTELKGIKAMRGFGVNNRMYRQEFNFGGRHMLSVKLKNGRMITFSTFKPREMEYFLRNLPEEVPLVRR